MTHQEVLITSAKPITNDALEKANKKLAGYSGARVQLWHYTSSHDMLALRVTLRDSAVIFLIFSATDRIVMPTFWRMENPVVSRKDEKDFVLKSGDVLLVFRELAVSWSWNPYGGKVK